MKLNVRIESQTFEVEIEDIHTIPVIALVDGQRFEVWPEHASAPVITPPVIHARSGSVAPSNGNGNGRAVYAPIPGVIVGISVKPGETVSSGQELCVLEAMKMKQSIRAARAGEIAAIHVAAGETVKHHALLIEYVDSAS